MGTRFSQTLPPLDEAAIGELERALPGGSLAAVLGTFADELKKRRSKLIELHAIANDPELSALAHGLKGSAATFCAPALAEAARALEDQLKGRDRDKIDHAVHLLLAEVGRAIEYLRQTRISRGLEPT